LASASPRRRELLERVGLALIVDPAHADERLGEGEAPDAYVARVAAAKARLVARRRPGAFVLGADTIVVLGDDVLGKAENADEARQMLGRLAGRSHRVRTAAALVTPAGDETGLAVDSTVEMSALSPATIAGYVESGEWRGKAGAYAVQGIGAALVRAVHGSYTNVVGLPLTEVLALLEGAGGPVADLARGQAA
jgi:septum formation protein